MKALYTNRATTEELELIKMHLDGPEADTVSYASADCIAIKLINYIGALDESRRLLVGARPNAPV